MHRYYTAEVRSKQGGPVYVHRFEASTVSALLAEMSGALNLDQALFTTTIYITPHVEA